MSTQQVVFGENVAVTLTHESSRFVARAGTHEVSLARVIGLKNREFVPIGTRVGSELEFVVDGDVVDLELGNGGLSRRSYRVSFQVGDRRLDFKPVDDEDSRLFSGKNCSAMYGNKDGVVSGSLPEGSAVESGYLELCCGAILAAAFGCGALSGPDALVEAALMGLGT